ADVHPDGTCLAGEPASGVEGIPERVRPDGQIGGAGANGHPGRQVAEVDLTGRRLGDLVGRAGPRAHPVDRMADGASIRLETGERQPVSTSALRLERAPARHRLDGT